MLNNYLILNKYLSIQWPILIKLQNLFFREGKLIKTYKQIDISIELINFFCYPFLNIISHEKFSSRRWFYFLREKGFSKVKITGKSGDQGIDGEGVLKINLISFRIIFQCKKYDGGVSPSEIRDFRGAISGNADRGIFLTTGHFRRAAIEEAERSGTNIIELIDGEEICNLLRELNIGIKTTEKISIDNEFFEEFKV